MKLVEFAKKLFNKGPELWSDTVEEEDTRFKAKIKRDTAKLRRCSLGLVSCDSAMDWYYIIRREAPASTSLEPYEEDKEEWDRLFNEVRILVRADLTQTLLTERNQRSAKTLLDVMERRDADRWSTQQKKLEVSAPGNPGGEIKVTFNGI